MTMMRSTLFLALAAAASAGSPFVAAGSPIVLDETNFEHLTQASTGATTGDWFIKFYAPWCGHCKRLAPTWEAMADTMKGKFMIAKVDCTLPEGRPVCSRFSVRGFPTVLFFHQGKYYKYEGGRSQSDMEQWLLGRAYEDAEGTDVPGLPGMLQNMYDQLETTVESIHLHKDPIYNAVLIGLLGGAAIMVPCFLLIVLCTWGNDAGPQQSRKAEPKMVENANGDVTPAPTDDGKVREIRKRVKATTD